ncbi:MAG: hypothetical protein HC903_09105 [Methylacidiphilales bacterium]|nr:hypothetical protein [Candidatus Methylacidiphilales bacterium]NJR16488.1 hypothetical protein [Calothrix sp. CSU_2_0]
MDNSIFVIFLIFGCIWILMGVGFVIAIMKADGQKIGFGKTGLLVAVPIIAPIIISLLYAAIKSQFWTYAR